MAKLTPAADTSTAEWIVAALRTFGESVLSLVPAGFSTYVRLFHPAYRHAADGLKPVGWADVADANGTRAHAAMQLIALTGSREYVRAAQPGVYDLPPREGSLPPELVEPLIAVLARRTTTSDAISGSAHFCSDSDGKPVRTRRRETLNPLRQWARHYLRVAFPPKSDTSYAPRARRRLTT